MSTGKHGITIGFKSENGKYYGGYAIMGYDSQVPYIRSQTCKFLYYENKHGGHMPWEALPKDLQGHISELVDEENELLARNRGR